MINQQNPTTMANERTYIGNGRQKAGSEYITLSICVEDLLAAAAQEAQEHSNGKSYLKVIVARKRITEYGNTHTVYAPHVPTEAERLEAEHNALADRQELEVLAADDRDA
jgi:hypothetical protein